MLRTSSANVRWGSMIRLTCLVCVLLLVISTGYTDARYLELFNRNSRSPAALGPPVRPKVFHTADELSTYLAELADYYAVLGRPRFGKRGSLSSSRFEPSSQLVVAQRSYRPGTDSEDGMEFLYDTSETGGKQKSAGNMLNPW